MMPLPAFFLRLLRPSAAQRQDAAREDILGAISAGHSTGAMEKDSRDRLLGALGLAGRMVDAVMRHRQDIEMIDAALPVDDIIAQILASPHSRLPLYRAGREDIVGVLHAKDLLREVDRLRRTEGGWEGLDVVKVAMKPYFIPDTTSLDEQMRAFLARSTHFALVVDEYGSLQGLITLEDILEEIVGEITDEFDIVTRGGAGLRQTAAGDYIVPGAMPLRDMNRALDWALPEDAANTVAGLVIHESQTIPQAGQVFVFHGHRFEVAERLGNRISKLHVRRM